ncbi:MAG: glycosyltransferase family 2 protein [Anaerolineales bacterium]|nr:glycosyltransferase family 2 protein [Anaerolineales bacterium]MDW8160562.1 glycosyltransferase family 2 protein [Anaerolineales bacterium]
MAWPLVSIVIPCYNEQDTIAALLEAISQQTYPLDRLEVIVADGMSTDNTRHNIGKFVAEHPELDVRVVENPDRAIPKALNRAIEQARGEIILRLDAHSQPYADYVERCVAALEAGKGDNVGGMWEIVAGSQTWIARSIAVAASHPLGVGDAHYRVGGRAQCVDTVPFGAYRRSLFERIGKFNEALLTNEDYELNARIRLNGGKIWFDPAIRMKYFARKSLSDLARQYWRYGYWKAKMLRIYPKTLRWRQLLPPLFVFSVLISLILSPLSVVARYGLFSTLGSYLLILAAVGAREALVRREAFLLVGLPLSIATMHFSWGLAFLWSLASANER